MGVRHVDDDERRARLARRHAIAPVHRVADVDAATRAVAVLHATEPPTVYLSLVARIDAVTRDHIDRALYTDRSLVKQLAMRRTLFGFPRDLLPAALASASRRVAGQQAALLAKDVAAYGIADDGPAWIEGVCAEVLELLADGKELSAQLIRAAVPALDVRTAVSVGKRYESNPTLGPRVLTLLGARGLVARGRNGGHWRIARPQWTSMEQWLAGGSFVGDVASADGMDADTGYAELVRRWLGAFGPGTEADIVWWLGATKGIVRKALADVGAVEVGLDGDGVGYLLADDVEPAAAVDNWAALLPVLDPTTMGWRNREFYLDPAHTPYLFDSNGNAGTTAWWNGRIVGCWVQDADGVVRVVLRDDVGAPARSALDTEASRLTEWLAGDVVNSVYASEQMKSARLR